MLSMFLINKIMALNRSELKTKFKNGSRPNQTHFGQLIDAGINFTDDGIQILPDGICFSKGGTSNYDGKKYQIKFGDDTINTLEFCRNWQKPRPLLTLADTGLTTGAMIVEGSLTAKRRSGIFSQVDVAGAPKPSDTSSSPLTGNGSWQTILHTAKICQAYEVVAQLYTAGRNHSPSSETTDSMLIAHVLTSASVITDPGRISVFTRVVDWVAKVFKKVFGISHTKIRFVQAYSDWLNNRIKIKWVEGKDSYSLQIKAQSGKIYYSVTCLWDKEFVPNHS